MNIGKQVALSVRHPFCFVAVVWSTNLLEPNVCLVWETHEALVLSVHHHDMKCIPLRPPVVPSTFTAATKVCTVDMYNLQSNDANHQGSKMTSYSQRNL